MTKKIDRSAAPAGTLETTYDLVIRDLREMPARPHGLLAEFQERKILAMAGGGAASITKMTASGLRDAYEALGDAVLALRREIPDNDNFPGESRQERLIYRSYVATLGAMLDVRTVIDLRRKPPILDVESAVRPLNGA